MFKRMHRVRFTKLAGICLGIVVAALLGSGTVQAIPLADYQKNLQHVIDSLDTLSQRDEDEDTTAYEKRFAETIASARIALPKMQLVQTETGNVSVENNWVHEGLDTLENGPTGKRRENLSHLLQQLKAVDQRVTELRAPATKTIDKEAAKERLNAILSRPEYAPKSKVTNAFWRWIEDFARWLEKLLPKQTPVSETRAFSLFRIAQYLVIGLCVIVIGYVARVFLPVLLKRKRKAKDKTKPEARVVLGEHIAADESAKDLLTDAESLARSGQLRAAIRKAYIALLVELGDRKLISLAQHRTNRDYLRSVRESPELYNNMQGLTEIFERNWYGSAQPTVADWQSFRDGY